MNSKQSALLTITTEKPRSYAISASASDDAPRRCVPKPGTRKTTGARPGWSRYE